MSESKSVSISFRVTPEFKRLLERVAISERRSQTNLLEKLVYDHCQRQELDGVNVKSNAQKEAKSGRHHEENARAKRPP